MTVGAPPLPPQPSIGRVNPNGTPTQAQIDYERQFAQWVNDYISSVVGGALPFPTPTTLGGVMSATAPTHQFQKGINGTGNPIFAQPAATDISGLGLFATATTVPAADITGLATVATSGLASDLIGSLAVVAPTPTTLGGLYSSAAPAFSFATGVNTSGNLQYRQPSFNDIGGQVLATQLPTPAAATLGGVTSLAAVSHKFLTSIGTDGVPVAAQPDFSDLSGSLATLTIGTHLTGTSYNGSAGVTISTDATNANTASTIVARDASGNFSAGTITASLTGAASLNLLKTNNLSDLSSAVTARSNLGLGTLAILNSPVVVSIGGTGITSYTLGDILYGLSAGALVTLGGNATTTKKYLSQTGTGSVSAAPAWAQVAFSDISGTASVAQGGTGQDTSIAWTTFTPTLLSGAGTITTVGSVSGRYLKLGRLLFFSYDLTIATNGTASSYLFSPLPAGLTAAAVTPVAGRDAILATPIEAYVTGSNIILLTPTGTYPGYNGAEFQISGFCETTT